MKNIVLLKILISGLAVLLLLAMVSLAQPSRNTILNDLNVVDNIDHSIIHIGFTFPVHYVRHYPINRGDEVHIQLELIPVNPSDLEELTKRESILPEENNSAKLVDVVYEGSDIGGRYLTIYFENPVTFEVGQGNDYRSLKVIVYPGETPAEPESTSSDLLSDADLAMENKDYNKAIRLYTKLARDEDAAISEEAQRKLGLAREKNGQIAHAKAEYRRYLALYPEGAGTEEVRNNLDMIISGSSVSRSTTRKVSDSDTPDKKSFWRKDIHGSFSQFYYRNERYTDADDKLVTRSLLNSGLDLNLRLRSSAMDIQTLFVGNHEEDFLDGDDSRTRVRSAYVDVRHKASRNAVRIGRQTHSGGGVLGRFDGGLFGYQFLEKARLNLVAGFPVSFSATGFDTDKHFLGASLDLGTLADRWDFSTFFIQQETKGITDRQAIGGEVRYFHPKGSFFSLADYDIFYEELNTFLVIGNYTLPSGITLSFSGDYRHTPSLTTSNALIGQIGTSLDQLINDLGEDSVQQLARDRTAVFRTATVGITQPINEKLQFGADITWFTLDGTNASGGVEETEGTGDEFYYSLQLLGNSLIKQGDLAILRLRYGDTDNFDIYSFDITTRYPVSPVWRINPRLAVDFRQNQDSSSDQLKIRPSLRTDYRWNKNLQFELEGGVEWSSSRTPGLEDDDSLGLFMIVGFRYRF